MKACRVVWRVAVLALVAGLGVVAVWAQGYAIAAVPSAAVGRARQAVLRASCANNLKQLALVLKMFANESKRSYYPRLSPEAGRLMFANEAEDMKPVYPEYMTDMFVMICPAGPQAGLLEKPDTKSDPKVLIDDLSYFYLGYVIRNEADMKAFAEAYKVRVAKGLKFDEDLDTPQGKLYLLREGVERSLVKKSNDPAEWARMQAETPVLIERLGHHEPEGSNVLFMDGHVEFLRYDTKWPMTKATMDVLKSLDEMKNGGK